MTLLGELTISRNDTSVKLPASRRTRALLGFLASTSRPHRRDRLCELFWEIPDDPRAALRWSLTKIRPLVNDVSNERLSADRERVSLLTGELGVDVHQLTQLAEKKDLSAVELTFISQQLNEPFLPGLDLPSQPLYQQWLDTERLALTRLQASVLGRLAGHLELTALQQLTHAQEWLTLDPFNTEAATRVLVLLERTGRPQDAGKLQFQLGERFRNAGIAWRPDIHAAEQAQTDSKNMQAGGRQLLTRQRIRFCCAADGARIAYASVGDGPPIVKAANWLSHLEHDWGAPIWSPLFQELARDHRLVRYDERGNGLSDWKVNEISFESFVSDLEAVVEAAGLKRFALVGISQGASVSIEYAVRHPQRVSHLILFGGYAAGWRVQAEQQLSREREAIITLTESGWGQDNPAYRQIFSTTFMPSASAEELNWFNEFQRLTTSPENAVRFLNVFADIDVRHRLAQVQVPVLVMHSLGDQRIPIATGREMAAAIPGAEFIALDSDGHLLLGHEPASKTFVSSVRYFLSRTPERETTI